MKKYLLIFTILLTSLFMIDNVNAETLFEQNEGKYYIVHKWVKNSSGSGNNYYYVGLFNNKPTISSETISDTENITYYKVSTDYTDLIRFLNTGSSAYYETKTTTNNSMKLNTDSSYMLFSNFDLVDASGNTYFAKNEYEYQVAVETITIDYVSIDDLNTQINFVSQIDNFVTNNTYNTNLVNFITSGDYLEYGQYYYIAGDSTYNANVLYISDDPNFLKISGNAFLIKASEEYPVYKYAPYSNTKGYLYEDSLSTTRTPVWQYYKNMDGTALMATNVNEIYLTEDTAFYFSTDDVRFEPSSLFYVNDGTQLHLSTHYFSNVLKLKNSFNSGTNAYGMAKVIWNINASTDLKAIDGNINMKIQYGANDFTNKNIPIFNNYKIYGYNEFESGWTDITNDDRFYFDDFQYEYYMLEGTATETVMTSTLHIPSDMCVYEQIKVEFYFDNTNNFYMYVFDELDDSSWQDLEYYFENYTYYEFPIDKKYAFISHATNKNNIGKIYVPYNDIINENSLFGAYIYDYIKNSVTSKLLSQKFIENSYYHYFDFEFSFDNNEIIMLQRRTGTEEKVYFYLPSDYIVEFSNSSKIISVLTPDGYIDINNDSIENNYRNDENENFIGFWNTFENSINYFIEPISEIFEKITVFFNSLPIEIQYAFYVAFIFVILYYLYKFIL